MKWRALLVLLGACSFEHGHLGTSIDGAIDAEEPASCLDGWCLRKPINVAGAQVSGTQQDFVLLVRTAADPELAAASSTGQDLHFTTATGGALAYERQRYVAATGELIAWVKLPSLAPADTTLYLYYGKPGAPEQQDAAATWAPNHAGVWHLDEPTGTVKVADATGNSNTGSALNSISRLGIDGPTLGVPAVVGEGVAFDGNDDAIEMAKSTSLSSTTGLATFALWLNWTSLTSSHFQRVMSSSNRFSSNGMTDDGYEWAAQPGGDFYLYPWGRVNDYNLGANPFTPGMWQYLVATLDFSGPTVKMYVDGQPMPFTLTYEDQWTTIGDPGDWCWGANPVYTGAFGGSMDEIRVMRGVRDQGWAATSFANQRPGSTMVTIGAEQRLEP